MDECPYAFRELLMQELLMSTMLNHMSSSVGFSSSGLKLEKNAQFLFNGAADLGMNEPSASAIHVTN